MSSVAKDCAETKKYTKVMNQLIAYTIDDRSGGGYICYACNMPMGTDCDMICKRCTFDEKYREGGFKKKCDKCGTTLEEGEIYVRDNLDLCFDCKYVEVQQ